MIKIEELEQLSAELQDLSDEVYGFEMHFDALVDLLIQKGVIKKEEFDKKLEEMEKEEAQDE